MTGNGTSTLTISGPLTTANAALNGLVYTPTSSFNGTDTLTLTTDDLGNTGTGGAKTTVSTVSITVVGIRPFAPNETFNVDESAVVNGTGYHAGCLGGRRSQALGPSATLISFTQPATGGTVTLAEQWHDRAISPDDKFVVCPHAVLQRARDLYVHHQRYVRERVRIVPAR